MEVGHTPDGHLFGIRDSKDPGPVLLVRRSSWQSFLAEIKAGAFD